ncbi:hypothetical protein HNR46_004265 [Haloferula luteola]|uniref:Intracellular proteinase inhibitor BsuPI domain-containing protein n=1 Tax=Haloferula luteola TaxID=595692 RepID=A0A840V8D9_9BACT|nr:hypothetical protein [Haloferula luteola]MBB5353993.1 hypothetical protein [Haloferula luteola]
MTTVSPLPREVRQGSKITLEVVALNRTRAEVSIPPSYYDGDELIMDHAGVIFVKDLESIAIVRNSVSICPPIFDRIGAGESQRFRFTWEASETDLGDGYLVVRLPTQFEQVNPLPIRVTR